MADLQDRTEREEELKRELAAVMLLYRDDLAVRLWPSALQRDLETKLRTAMVGVFMISARSAASDLGFALDSRGAGTAWSTTYSQWLSRRVVTNTLAELDPLATRAQRIQELDDLLTPDRWDALAATEITRAQVAGGEFGSLIFTRSKGVIPAALWHSEDDSRVCNLCRPLDQTERDVWATFYPMGPPVHPNCRCSIEYSFGIRESYALESEGHWVTIRGVHVLIGKDGKILKGPKGVVGKHVDELEGDWKASPKSDPKHDNKAKHTDTGGFKAKLQDTLLASTFHMSDVHREKREIYQQAVRSIVEKLNDQQAEKLAGTVKHALWYTSIDDCASAYSAISGIESTKTGGFYSPRQKALGVDSRDPPGVLAHEIGHALDWDGDDFASNKSPEWAAAWKSEIAIGTKPLSDYATESKAEGFAEFARLAIQRPDMAKKGYPLSWAYWESAQTKK